MLRTRILVGLCLLSVALVAIYLGGWFLILAAAGMLAVASLEYASLFQSGGHHPSGPFIALASTVVVLARGWIGFEHTHLLISLVVLIGMSYFLLAYEHGNEHAATDFAISISGVFYIGWLGAYLVSLRMLPDGMWWLLLVSCGIWSADSFAYLVGVRFGKHKLTQRLSPKKSWEGLFGGVVFSVLITAGLGALIQNWAGVGSINAVRGAVLGSALSIFPVLGDLGESMIKRQFGVKDSSNLLPGHGGIFDRIDSWLWADVIGFYLITLFFLS